MFHGFAKNRINSFRVKHEEGIPGSDFDAEPIQTALEKNKTLQHLHLIVSSNDRDEFFFQIVIFTTQSGLRFTNSVYSHCKGFTKHSIAKSHIEGCFFWKKSVRNAHLFTIHCSTTVDISPFSHSLGNWLTIEV